VLCSRSGGGGEENAVYPAQLLNIHMEKMCITKTEILQPVILASISVKLGYMPKVLNRYRVKKIF
jgi:hypothetical protein